MKQEVLIGQTDYTVLVLIRDTAGAPKTGLDEGDIDIAYARVETDNDVTTADVTPAALSALTDAHTDWGFEEVSSTDHPGLYRLDLADAVFASGAWSAVVSIVGTGLDPTSIEFVLVAFNPRDGVRLGLTALPNAAADAAGGLPISDAGGLDLDSKLAATNEVTAARMGALTDWIDGGRLDLILDARASQTSVDDLPTNAELEARTLVAAGYATAAALATVDGNVDLILEDTGTTLPATLVTILGHIDTEVAAILADTDELQQAWADGGRLDLILDARASQASVNTIDGIVDDILLDTAQIGAAGAGLTEAGGTGDHLTALRLSGAGVDDILDEAVEGAVTLRQSMRLHNAVLGGKASGLATTEATYRNLGDTKDVVVATVDADGNRDAVTRDLT